MNKAMRARNGFQCQIKNCQKSKNRLFTQEGLRQHLRHIHSIYFKKSEIKKVMKYGLYIEEPKIAENERLNKILERLAQFERTKVSGS